jgi:hypothetical protein
VGSIPASGTKEDEPRPKAIGRKQLSFVGRSVIASPCRITRANGYAGKEAIKAPSGVVMNAAEITLARAADSARQENRTHEVCVTSGKRTSCLYLPAKGRNRTKTVLAVVVSLVGAPC